MKEETPSDMEDIIVISGAFLSSAWIWAGDFSQLTSKKSCTIFPYLVLTPWCSNNSLVPLLPTTICSDQVNPQILCRRCMVDQIIYGYGDGIHNFNTLPIVVDPCKPSFHHTQQLQSYSFLSLLLRRLFHSLRHYGRPLPAFNRGSWLGHYIQRSITSYQIRNNLHSQKQNKKSKNRCCHLISSPRKRQWGWEQWRFHFLPQDSPEIKEYSKTRVLDHK